MFSVLIAWALIILVGIGCNKKELLHEMNMKPLRGICSVEIMIGHIGIATGNIWLYPNRKAGILFVGVFFILSGYGLMYSVKNKENYLNNFVYRKIKRLILPAWIVFMTFEMIEYVLSELGGGGIEPGGIF